MKYIIPAGENHDFAVERVTGLIHGLDSDKPWHVEIKRWRKTRSNEQLAYYFGVVIRIACDETGNDSDDMHQFLCGSYFGWTENEIFGQVKKRPIRTLTAPDKLPVEDMTKFIEWCVPRLAREGILIPLPNEVI